MTTRWQQVISSPHNSYARGTTFGIMAAPAVDCNPTMQEGPVVDQFTYERTLKEIQSKHRVLCCLCKSSDTYSEGGLMQHMKSAHKKQPPTADFYKTCSGELHKLVVQETRNLLQHLSSYNEVSTCRFKQ